MATGHGDSDSPSDISSTKSPKREEPPSLSAPSGGSIVLGLKDAIEARMWGKCTGNKRGDSGEDEGEPETSLYEKEWEEDCAEEEKECDILGRCSGSRKGGKEFRRRRLTFATQGKMSSNVSPPEASAITIYRALELGEEDAGQTAPFPASVLGIYSCHGAEPGWEEGEEDLAKINQDRACVVHPYLGSDTCALLCVYDGHGERGDVVSNFTMNEIPARLAKHPKVFDDPEVALKDTFEEVDRALVDAAAEDEQVYSGTTAVVALYRDGMIWVANAGDSRAVLGTLDEKAATAVSDGDPVEEKLVAVALSNDHNPDRPGELERIESCGGFVSPPPEEGLSARVWLDQEMTRIGLAMARSIGDHAVKGAGVVATPEVMIRKVSVEDMFIILASDGVWEFMKSDEVVRLVHERLKEGGGSEATGACADVISVAAARWRQYEGAYRDDISCVVLRLPCFQTTGEHDSPAHGGVPSSPVKEKLRSARPV